MLKLICTTPMHAIRRGDEVTDELLIAKLLATNPHHFVKVVVPDPEPVKDESAPVDSK